MSTKQASAKARIFLVDDHALLRHGLAQLINQQTDLEVCGQAERADQALHDIMALNPDVVVADLSLDRDISGIELIKTLKARCPQANILVLSMHDELVFAERTLRAGARGYVMKDEPLHIVLDAVRQVLHGHVWLSDNMTETMLADMLNRKPDTRRFPVERLSDRELEVLQLVGRGLGASLIAQKLHLSVKTIETHRANIKEKLNLPDAAALLEYAIQWIQAQRLG